MQSSGIFKDSYDYYVNFLGEIALELQVEKPKLAEACMYAVDLVRLLQSLSLNLPDRLKFDFEKSRLRFEWEQDGAEVVFLISDEEIRSIVYREGSELIELNTVQRGGLALDSLIK